MRLTFLFPSEFFTAERGALLSMLHNHSVSLGAAQAFLLGCFASSQMAFAQALCAFWSLLYFCTPSPRSCVCAAKEATKQFILLSTSFIYNFLCVLARIASARDPSVILTASISILVLQLHVFLHLCRI